jgi:hypothetical protein
MDTMALIDTYIIQKKSQDHKLLFQAANYYSITNRDAPQAITWLLEAEKWIRRILLSKFETKLAADLKIIQWRLKLLKGYSNHST